MERDRTHCISNTPVHSLELVAPTLLWYASGTKGVANMHAIEPCRPTFVAVLSMARLAALLCLNATRFHLLNPKQVACNGQGC